MQVEPAIEHLLIERVDVVCLLLWDVAVANMRYDDAGIFAFRRVVVVVVVVAVTVAVAVAGVDAIKGDRDSRNSTFRRFPLTVGVCTIKNVPLIPPAPLPTDPPKGLLGRPARPS